MIGHPRREPQAGMVLVTSLLLLIVVTVLAVGMFRSFGLDEKIAGNMREKHRALTAAEAAEQYAEWWLANGNGTNGVPCTGPVALSALTVCSNLMTTPTQLPWTVGTTYLPNAPTGLMPINTAGGPNNYVYAPAFYISYLGPWPLGNVSGILYQIDAVGYAGSYDTAAVVESTYVIKFQSTCKSCSPGPG